MSIFGLLQTTTLSCLFYKGLNGMRKFFLPTRFEVEIPENNNSDMRRIKSAPVIASPKKLHPRHHFPIGKDSIGLNGAA